MQTKDIRDAFFDEVYAIAANDKNVVFITADADAFSLRRYQKDMPERFVNAGVAEQNMVIVASGLALSGKSVFIYAIIPFITLRCLEQIKVNICSMNLSVTIVGAGAGFSFTNDGPTHHAVSDIAVMRSLPEMDIYNPCDAKSAQASARLAYQNKRPCYVRLDKGQQPDIHQKQVDFSLGFAVIRPGEDVALVSTGTMVHRARLIAEELEKQGISVQLIDLYRIKPLSQDLIKAINKVKKIVTLEENVLTSGIGSMLSELITDNQLQVPLKRIALKDEQCFLYGSRDWILKQYKLDQESVLKEVRTWYEQ